VGERLCILTNGGGPGVMATDALVLGHGRLAALSPPTLARLDAALPATWSHGNPVDIGGDAPAERYAQALRILLVEPACAAVLFLQSPTAIVPSADIAAAVAPIACAASKPLFGCWLGGDAVRGARAIFARDGIPDYDTPESAVNAFLQTVEYRRNQQLLLDVPAAPLRGHAHDHAGARAAVARGMRSGGSSILSEADSKAVLGAYGIPVVETRVAADIDDAVRCADALGYPVALKIISPQITHKSDVGGVALGLDSAAAVIAAGAAMRERVARARPGAVLAGFTVQPMVRRANAHELIVGAASDAVFGPVILFGAGGTAVEVTADRAVGLPPLNAVLARDLIGRTRVAKVLAGYRDRPAADTDAIARVLTSVSDLLVGIPQIIELDINPLLADENGVVALDARIVVHPTERSGADRFAIRPYPAELETHVAWGGTTLLVRPVKPEDGAQQSAFFDAMTADDLRDRMLIPARDLRPAQLARLTQIDYDREMAFVAVRTQLDGRAETLGIARAIADPDRRSAEFEVIVRSDLKGQGLGAILLQRLTDYSRARGIGRLVGVAHTGNARLFALARRQGFTLVPSSDGRTTTLVADLASATA
jgi:acetyltransferase